MKVLAAHQPNFLPYLGLFYKIFKSETFVFVDNVQFSCQRGISHHRNLIKTPQGSSLFMVPVQKRITSMINEVEIDDTTNWRKKLLRTFEVNYKKAPYFDDIYDWIDAILHTPFQYIADLNMHIIKDVSIRMGAKVEWHITSENGVSGHKNELVLNIMKTFGSDIYYSGTGAQSYLNVDLFRANGYDILYSDYIPRPYPQLWGNAFIGNLSVIDYLFNAGFSNPFIEQEENDT